MTRIQVMDPHLAAKIAAGEVIERPLPGLGGHGVGHEARSRRGADAQLLAPQQPAVVLMQIPFQGF